MPSYHPLKALIFDLDGLIVDTETPDYKTWQDVYGQYGQQLPLSKWGEIIGGTGASDFDPFTYLEHLCGENLDKEAIWIQRRKTYVEILENTDCLPGVCELVNAATAAGLALAVASSSPENWVIGHLTRLNLLDDFAVIVTADDVEKTKPDPALFLLAQQRLEVEKGEAIIFEDSPNGVAAARAAGIFVIAIPNLITQQMDLSAADLILPSLVDLSMDMLAGCLNQTA